MNSLRTLPFPFLCRSMQGNVAACQLQNLQWAGREIITISTL